MKKKIIGAPDPLKKVMIGVTQQDLVKVMNLSNFAARMIFMTWKEAYDTAKNAPKDVIARGYVGAQLSNVCAEIDRTLTTLPETVAKSYTKLQHDYLDELEKLPKV